MEADTTYFYKVGQEGNYSETKSFQTAKAGEDITVAFYGDIQGAYTKFPNTIEAPVSYTHLLHIFMCMDSL